MFVGRSTNRVGSVLEDRPAVSGASDDKSAKRWNTVTGECTLIFAGFSGEVMPAGFLARVLQCSQLQTISSQPSWGAHSPAIVHRHSLLEVLVGPDVS